MGRVKPLQDWIERYESFHQNPINRRIHLLCVPLIITSLIGLLWCVPVWIPGTETWYPSPNLAMVVMVLVSIYYLRLSISIMLGVCFWAFLSAVLVLSIEASPLSVFWSSFGLFALGLGRAVFRTSSRGSKAGFSRRSPIPFDQPGMVGERDASKVDSCRRLLHGHDHPSAGDRRYLVCLETLH